VGGETQQKGPLQPLVGPNKKKKSATSPTRGGDPILAGLTIVPISMVSLL